MNPTNEQELREQVLREIAFYGDMCAQHQSTLHFGKFTVDQRNAAIRKSIYSQGLPELIQAYTNAEIAKVLDRLDKQINWNKHDMGELGEFIRTVYAHNAVQAERAKLKEVK